MTSAQPPLPEPEGIRPLDTEDFSRWYGGWDPLDPTRITEFMKGFDRPWWIVGGWSLEAFTGVTRDHADMDISILSGDAEAFRLFLGDRWTAWNVDDSWFRPFDHRFTAVRPDSQVWVRRDAGPPWILDVPFTPETDGRWTNKRDPDHTEDLEDITWIAPDGLRYARPEVTLMFKASQDREKDRRDARVALPLLDDEARGWLRATVARIDADHPWAHLP